MVDPVDHGPQDLLDRGEVDDEPSRPVHRTFDHDRHHIVVPVQGFAFVVRNRQKMRGGEGQVILPEQAFYMVGNIDEVLAKAKTL